MNDADPPLPPPAPPPGLGLPPWEERQRYGVLTALYLTLRDVLFSPAVFFGRMPPRAGLWQPLLFAIVVGVISAFFAWMWSLAGSSLQVLMQEDMGRLLGGPLYSGLFWLFSPLWIFMLVLLRAGIVHLGLLLLGDGKLGFEATLRAVAYSDAVWILVLVPFCGHLAAVVWGTFLAILGLQRLHQCDVWRASLAVLLPMMLCLVSCGGGLVLLLTLGQGLRTL